MKTNLLFTLCLPLLFYSCKNGFVSNKHTLFMYLGKESNIVIPNSITTIGHHAFNGNKIIQSIQIPNSVQWIGRSAFENCSSLDSIHIPNSVKYLRNHAFSNCSSLKKVKLSSNIEIIEWATFNRCSALESITIPRSVRIIEAHSFVHLPSLSYIRVEWCIPPQGINPQAFSNISSTSNRKQSLTLQVPKGSKEAYMGLPWDHFEGIEEYVD